MYIFRHKGIAIGGLDHNLIRNRTANTRRLPGKNIALDLLCEHTKNDFKGSLNDLEILMCLLFI